MDESSVWWANRRHQAAVRSYLYSLLCRCIVLLLHLWRAICVQLCGAKTIFLSQTGKFWQDHILSTDGDAVMKPFRIDFLKAFGGWGLILSPRQPSLNHLLCMQTRLYCQGVCVFLASTFVESVRCMFCNFQCALDKISSLNILFDIVILKYLKQDM